MCDCVRWSHCSFPYPRDLRRYATLCVLASVNSVDFAPGVPPIDSIDQWPTILKKNATWTDGARQEMVLAYNNGSGRVVHGSPSGYDAALIHGRYKIVTGHQGASGFWTGQVHPNGTGPPDPKRNESACGAFACCEGCLYDIQSDPTEHVDLRLSMPDMYATMYERLMVLASTTYQTDYIQPGIECLTAQQAKSFYKGFRGPPCFNTSHFPVVPPTPTPALHSFQLASPDETWCISGQKLGLTRCAGKGAAQTTHWTVGDAETGELEYVAAGSASTLCIKLVEEPGWNCANHDNRTAVSLRHCSAGPGGGAHKSNYFHIASPLRQSAGSDQVLVRSNDCPDLCLARLRSGFAVRENYTSMALGEQPTSATAMSVGLAPCVSGHSSTAILWLRKDMEHYVAQRNTL